MARKELNFSKKGLIRKDVLQILKNRNLSKEEVINFIEKEYRSHFPNLPENFYNESRKESLML